MEAVLASIPIGTDFTLLTKNGVVIQCHKFVLAKNCPFYAAMLSNNFVEGDKNQANVTDFEGDTVSAFLEYLYSDKVSKVALELAKKHDPELAKTMISRHFPVEKISPTLLEMAQMYQVEDLQDDCCDYLMKNINHDNVVDVWMAARKIESSALKEAALKHIFKSYTQNPDDQIPGFEDIYNTPELVKEFTKYTYKNIPKLPKCSDQASCEFHVLVKGLGLLETQVCVYTSDTYHALKDRVALEYEKQLGKKLCYPDYTLKHSNGTRVFSPTIHELSPTMKIHELLQRGETLTIRQSLTNIRSVTDNDSMAVD